jgi:hypothetical protein
MIEDAAVNEFVRSACLRSLVVLVVEGELTRDHAVEYFRGLFQGKLKREPGFIWGALISASCDLYPKELLQEIQQAYDDQLVDLSIVQMDDVQHTLAQDKQGVLREFKQYRGSFIEDTITEMRWWACFKQDTRSAYKQPTAANQPVIKKQKIGRNDPCPCGSGKKYKKCCLN